MYKNDLSKMMTQQQVQMQQSQQQAMMVQQQQNQPHMYQQQLQQMQQQQHIQNPMSQEQQLMNQQQMTVQQQMVGQQQMGVPQQMAMQQMGQQQMPMQQQQQQQQQQVQHQQQEQKFDNISKVKTLFSQLNETLMDTLRMSGINLQTNSKIDEGHKHEGELSTAKYEECMEKFYSICDQMELHLTTAGAQQYQIEASQRHTPTSVSTNPPPDIHKYTHYINNVKQQVTFAKELRSSLTEATTGAAPQLPPPARPQPSHHDPITPMDTQT